jgi:hypothetical protein
MSESSSDRDREVEPQPGESSPPDPGTVAAPDATTEGVDPSVTPSGEELERVAESGVGPGAGETDLVKVTTPRDVRDEDVARHPSLNE